MNKRLILMLYLISEKNKKVGSTFTLAFPPFPTLSYKKLLFMFKLSGMKTIIVIFYILISKQLFSYLINLDIYKRKID